MAVEPLKPSQSTPGSKEALRASVERVIALDGPNLGNTVIQFLQTELLQDEPAPIEHRWSLLQILRFR